MEQSNLFSVVTIKEIVKVYKGFEEANAIEWVTFEENGFGVIAKKGLYKVGDKALYVFPDTCVKSDLFEQFIKPEGDYKKSRLGKIEGIPARVRAIKFKFNFKDSLDDIFSNGIAIPLSEVNVELTEETLGLYKYEEPEMTSSVKQVKSGGFSFPSGIYKTDETNFYNICRNIDFPIDLNVTSKVDGSSCSIIFNKDYPDGAVASRNLVKPMTVKKCIGVRKKTLLERLQFWKKFDLRTWSEVPNQDDFLKQGLPVLQKIKEINPEIKDMVFRFELAGVGFKGSGISVNPHKNLPPKLYLYNIDVIENGVAKKVDVEKLTQLAKEYDLTMVQIFDYKKIFNSIKEIEEYCNNIFKDNMIEGVVLKSMDSKFSCKFMNNEYDSKK